MPDQDSVFSPVTLFYGDDLYMLEQELHRRMEAFLDQDARPFDLEVLSADEVTAEQVASAANTFPVMAQARLVILRKLEKWKPGEVSKLSAGYLSNPSPTTLLLLCFAGKPDMRRKVFKELLSHTGEVRQFKPAGGMKIISWIETYMSRKNIALGTGAAQAFLDLLGSDLHRIKRELEKVELFHVGKGTTLEVKDVEMLLERTARRSVFDFISAACFGKRKEAAKLLEQLLDDGEEPLAILALLSRRYRQLHQARTILADGGDGRDVSRELHLSPRWTNDLISELKATGDASVESALFHIARADTRLKSSRTDASVILHSLLGSIHEESATGG